MFTRSILALSLLLSASAFAERAPVETAKLDRGQIDADILGNYKFGVANVIVDHDEGFVSLVIHRVKNCRPDRPCTRELPVPVRVQLPINSYGKDGCGSTVIRASRDDRPVDGIYQEVVVKDARKQFCKTLLPVPPTTVIYRTEMYNRLTGQVGRTRSVMTGEELSPMVFAQ